MSNIEFHAKKEFRAAGWVDENGEFKDEMQEAVCKHVMKLLQMFAEEGHSGFSAEYTLSIFDKLARFQPLVPLTGEDWEWEDVSEYSAGDKTVKVYQNKRCSHVFKQTDRFDGQAYDIDAVIFWDWYTDPETGEKSKSYFTCSDSLKPITFPYTPKKEYQERIND